MAFSFTDISKPKAFTGVEIIQVDDGYVFHFVVLRKVKGSIKLIEEGLNIHSFDELLTQLPKDIPIALSINTKGIIHREIQGKNIDSNSLMRQVLPDANKDDFLVQYIPTEQGHLVSLSRKDLSNTWIDKFDEEGFWILAVGLGAFTIDTVMPFIRERTFATTTYTLNYSDDNQLLDFQKEWGQASSNVLLGNERLDSYLLPSVSVAFNALMEVDEVLDDEKLKTLQQEYSSKWWFSTVGTASLITILLLLLGSFFIGNQLKNQNRALGIEISLKENQLEKIEELQAKISQYGNGGNSTPSKTSFYADQLATTIPNTIKLEILEIHPIKGEERDYSKGDMIVYQSNKIRIQGITNNSVNYNQWLEELRKEDWIEDAEHINYEDTKEGVGEFELEIMIKE